MSNLKAKLAHKIEGAADNTLNTSTGGIIAENNTKEDNNLILLKPNEVSNEFSYVPDFQITLNEARDTMELLQNFVKEMMIPKVDYGFISNYDKPALFKAGAEKLCDIFGFSKQLEILNGVEDWKDGLFHYEVKAILINKRSGVIEAEGIGSCNSKERKYIKQDSYSLINTILKMAKKRAFVDAVLSATRSSGIFTQDVEELEDNELSKTTEKRNKNSKNTGTTNKKPIEAIKEIPITKEQQTQIVLTINKNKIPIQYAKGLMQEKYKVEESKLLTANQAGEFIYLLKCSTII